MSRDERVRREEDGATSAEPRRPPERTLVATAVSRTNPVFKSLTLGTFTTVPETKCSGATLTVDDAPTGSRVIAGIIQLLDVGTNPASTEFKDGTSALRASTIRAAA
jgi:hypothetical protein